MPVAATSRFPGIKFRVAGKTNPPLTGPASYPPNLSSTCWWDLSTRVTTFDCQVGSGAGPGERLASGGAFHVNLLNTDRKLDRLNTGSSMYQKLLPGIPVWMQLIWAGTTYDVFHGILDQSEPQLDPGGASWVKMSGFDRLASWLDNPIAPTTSTAGVGRFDRTGARIERAILQAGISGINLSWITTGEALMDATTWGQTLGAEITAALAVEGGESRVWMKRNGRIEYWAANTWREQTRSFVSQRTYSSAPTDLRYAGLAFAERRDRTRNVADVSRAGSTMGYKLASTAYRDRYGLRSTSMPGMRSAFDADARALPDQTIWRHRELIYSVDAVTVQPERNPASAWPKILAEEIMDRVTVKWRTAVNRGTNLSGSTYTLDGMVTGWHLSLDWPAQTATYECWLDSAVPIFSSTGGAVWFQLNVTTPQKLGY